MFIFCCIIERKRIRRAAIQANDEIFEDVLNDNESPDARFGDQKGPRWDYKTGREKLRGGYTKRRLYLWSSSTLVAREE